MDDVERWLRASMRAVHQEPSPNLLSGVWRRRREHVRRVGACGAAAVAVVAIAVPSVLYSAQSAPLAKHPVTALRTPPGAAPGSELLKCGAYSDRGIAGGNLGAHWQSASVQAGPIWFAYTTDGLWRSSQRLPDGKFRAVAGVVIAVRNGTTVEITTPPADRSRFRFITRETKSGSYTMRDGVRGLTLIACPRYPLAPGLPKRYAPSLLTLFYLPLGYVADLGGCLPLEIATPPSWHVRWTARLSRHGVCNS